MNEPRRLLDDPSADPVLQRALGRGAARSLDELTRRRLRSRLARAAALPAVAAWWLFVKSAVAALGVVGVAATAATVTGVLEWRSARPAKTPALTAPALRAPRAPEVAPAAAMPEPVAEPAPLAEPAPNLNPTPTVPAPAPSASSAASLAAESAMLEQSRREMRRAPAVALQLADEHAARFPRGQLASERALLQVEALHRLGRAAEARLVAGGLLQGKNGDLYRERVRRLLGDQVVR
jgi:hypothetical protein